MVFLLFQPNSEKCSFSSFSSIPSFSSRSGHSVKKLKMQAEEALYIQIYERWGTGPLCSPPGSYVIDG